MSVKLQVNIDEAQEFADKLAYCIRKNPDIMAAILTRAMREFAVMGPSASLNGGKGLRKVTGKVYQAGFKQWRKLTPKYSVGVFTARIANIFQGEKKGNLPDIPIMRLAEKAFRKAGIMEKITREEMEKVYND